MLMGNGKELRISQSQCGTMCGTDTEFTLFYCVISKDYTEVMAEGAGFEPALELPLNTLSKRAPSATRPPLH